MYTPYPPYVRPPLRLPRAAKKDYAAAGLALLLGVLTVNFVFYGGFNLGFTICYALWVLLAAVYLLSAKLRPSPYAVFCGLSALALSITFSLYSDPFSKMLLLAAITVLSVIALLSDSRSNQYAEGSLLYFTDILQGLFYTPFAFIGPMFRSLFPQKTPAATESDPAQPFPVKKHKTAGAVLCGLACALPVLIVVVPLLMRADAAFDHLLHVFFTDAQQFLVSVLFGCVLFLFVFPALSAYRHRAVQQQSDRTMQLNGSAPTAGIYTFLGMIGIVYLIYLFSQLQYFTGGFAMRLPGEYSYSAYAVRGFFEMCVISVINMLIVFFTLLLLKKEGGKLPRAAALLELFVCLFSLFVIVSDLAKMGMYIQSYGMTKLRVLTSVFMLTLACCFIFIALRLFVRKFPYFKAAVIAVTLIGLTVAFVNIDTAIAKYNVAAYQNGRLSEMDVETLGGLSSAAVPEIARLLKADDPEVAAAAAQALYAYAKESPEFETGNGYIALPKKPTARDFRAYNRANARAADAIQEHLETVNQLLEWTE